MYITDGDDDGRRYRQELEAEGVPKERIFGLDEIYGDSVELEDLIDPELYASAVNDVFRLYQAATVVYPIADIPSTGRAGALDEWCESRGLKPPSKQSVAQQLLDIKSAHLREGKQVQLLAKARSKPLAKFCTTVNAMFNPVPKRRRPRR